MQGLLKADGTLLLTIRTSAAWDNFDGFLDSNKGQVVDRHGVLVVAGLAFIEGFHRGIDLTGVDPVYHIEQTCLALAHKEYDQSIPEVAEYIARLTQEKFENDLRYKLIEDKSKAILEAHLIPEQLEEFRTKKEFHVRGG